MKNQTHTPTPWRIQGNGTLLHPVTRRPLTTTRIETTFGNIEILDETNEPEYNSEFICRAVNSHEQMFSAIVKAVELLQMLHDDCMIPNYAHDAFNTCPLCRLITDLRAAIAAASSDAAQNKFMALDCHGSPLQFTGGGHSVQCAIKDADLFESRAGAVTALTIAEESGGRVVPVSAALPESSVEACERRFDTAQAEHLWRMGL